MRINLSQRRWRSLHARCRRQAMAVEIVEMQVDLGRYAGQGFKNLWLCRRLISESSWRDIDLYSVFLPSPCPNQRAGKANCSRNMTQRIIESVKHVDLWVMCNSIVETIMTYIPACQPTNKRPSKTGGLLFDWAPYLPCTPNGWINVNVHCVQVGIIIRLAVLSGVWSCKRL